VHKIVTSCHLSLKIEPHGPLVCLRLNAQQLRDHKVVIVRPDCRVSRSLERMCPGVRKISTAQLLAKKAQARTSACKRKKSFESYQPTFLCYYLSVNRLTETLVAQVATSMAQTYLQCLASRSDTRRLICGLHLVLVRWK